MLACVSGEANKVKCRNVCGKVDDAVAVRLYVVVVEYVKRDGSFYLLES